MNLLNMLYINLFHFTNYIFYFSKLYQLGKPSLKKREYIKTFDLKEGGGQFENLIIQK